MGQSPGRRWVRVGVSAVLVLVLLITGEFGAAAESPDAPPSFPAGSAGPPAPAPADEPGGSGGEIVGGTVAGPGEFRFIVGILDAGTSDNSLAQYCGGTLISRDRVITAAHCVVRSGLVTPADQIDVLVGTNRLDGTGQRIRVRRVHVHPSYDPFTSRHDLAALDLTQATNQPNLLQARPNQSGLANPGRSATVAGWGRSHPTNNIRPVDKLKATVPVRARATCESNYPGPDFKYFHSSNVCAGSPGINACSGDSGGPLFTRNPSNRWVQIGIVSFGPTQCGTFPAAYARTSSYSANNDLFSLARRIPDRGGRVRGVKSFTAAKQVGEPNHADNIGGASVWYTWRAPSNRRVTITTNGSNFDTTLAVYRGGRVNNLTRVAANDDQAPGDLRSRVRFRARRNVTYRIAVDGYNGDFGNVVVNVADSDPLVPLRKLASN